MFSTTGKHATHTVVITGGTKGIGRALAREFVKHGDNVMLCSRDSHRVTTTTAELQTLAAILKNRARVEGRVVDVSLGMRDFLEDAARTFGCIDAVINNAATNAYAYQSLVDQSPADIVDIIATNVLGTTLGTREALRIMQRQRHGHVFNVLGGGAMGEPTPNFAVYGATKAFVNHLCKSIPHEKLEDRVCVHRVNPGIVDTELLTTGLGQSFVSRVVRASAVPPETVAKRLVPQMRRLMSNPRAVSSSIRACPPLDVFRVL